MVYQKALQWLLDVYRLCRTFPDYERFALTSQIRRAAVSVTSNIAEGMSRSSDREVVHFLEISYGSLMEVQSQLEVAQLLNYISKDSLDDVDPKTEEIAKMLSGLKKSKMR
ncbi:four helix bundle protein [Fibrobacter succinogenes]|uniref:four helix bundle protein n=1 Tax=Fibrobacter succinogenes TaxID=833 RepID=UPI00200B4BF7|nr:four helix bundle protein [Fibrobacter succinogenes]